MRKDEVVAGIIKLAQQRREGEPISNEEIYHYITKRQRYNRKAWEELKTILREIAGKTIKGYLFFVYSPMLASRFNFKLNPKSKCWQWWWVSGFQLWRRDKK